MSHQRSPPDLEKGDLPLRQQPLRFEDILTLDGLKIVVDWLRRRGVLTTDAVPADLLEVFIGCFADAVPADLLEVFIGCFASLHALQHAKVYIFCNFARYIGDMADNGPYPTTAMKDWLVSCSTPALQ